MIITRKITYKGTDFYLPYNPQPQVINIVALDNGEYEMLHWLSGSPAHISARGGTVVAALTVTGITDYEILSGDGVTVGECNDTDVVNYYKPDKKAEIAAARYTSEIAGIAYEGNLIATDRDSQSLITGAALAATLDSTYTLRWKMENGEFIQLTSSQIIEIAQAVRGHVQECFDKEATLVAQVEAATDKTALSAIIINF